MTVRPRGLVCGHGEIPETFTIHDSVLFDKDAFIDVCHKGPDESMILERCDLAVFRAYTRWLYTRQLPDVDSTSSTSSQDGLSNLLDG
jgi:hypothetical protein